MMMELIVIALATMILWMLVSIPVALAFAFAFFIMHTFLRELELATEDENGTVTFYFQTKFRVFATAVIFAVLMVIYLIGLSEPTGVLFFSLVVSALIVFYYWGISKDFSAMFVPALISLVGVTFMSLANRRLELKQAAPWIFVGFEVVLIVITFVIAYKSSLIDDDEDDDTEDNSRNLLKENLGEIIRDFFNREIDVKGILKVVGCIAAVCALIGAFVVLGFYLEDSFGFFTTAFNLRR